MASLTHPFDPDTLYELDGDGNIKVSNGNQVGIFTKKGQYISGDIKQADPQLCVWVGNNPDDAMQQMSEGRTSITAKRT